MSVSKILIGSTAVLILAGCGGSSSKSSPSGQSSGTGVAAPASSTASSPASNGGLSKAAFITQMNTECKAVDTRVQALPQPAAVTDYANVIANLTGTIKEFPGYLTQVDILVNQSPDAAELQQKWIGPERTQLSNFTLAANKVIADARAKNATKIQTDVAGLDKANSNSKTIGAYLTSYGLTDCASLEDS